VSSYSRRRPASKGDITAPTHRTHQDAVSGEIVTVELDGVQLAFEGVARWFETMASKFNLTAAERERLAVKLVMFAAAQMRHTDADLDALAALLVAMNGR
jgi:hypothetical protein